MLTHISLTDFLIASAILLVILAVVAVLIATKLGFLQKSFEDSWCELGLHDDEVIWPTPEALKKNPQLMHSVFIVKCSRCDRTRKRSP